jgi:hypothetical protein
MPELARFYGIIIRMYYEDHNPPHFHAIYGEHSAEYNLQTLEVLQGSVPQRAHALVLEWATQHRQELMEDWELTRHGKEPKKIDPLP